jgi:hypothetical protein
VRERTPGAGVLQGFLFHSLERRVVGLFARGGDSDNDRTGGVLATRLSYSETFKSWDTFIAAVAGEAIWTATKIKMSWSSCSWAC